MFVRSIYLKSVEEDEILQSADLASDSWSMVQRGDCRGQVRVLVANGERAGRREAYRYMPCAAHVHATEARLTPV